MPLHADGVIVVAPHRTSLPMMPAMASSIPVQSRAVVCWSAASSQTLSAVQQTSAKQLVRHAGPNIVVLTASTWRLRTVSRSHPCLLAAQCAGQWREFTTHHTVKQCGTPMLTRTAVSTCCSYNVCTVLTLACPAAWPDLQYACLTADRHGFFAAAVTCAS